MRRVRLRLRVAIPLSDIFFLKRTYSDIGHSNSMHLNDTILNVIKQNLKEGWLSETYDWTTDFVNLYCTDWFYTASDCFYAIENDAMIYSNMIYFTLSHGQEYTSTVDLFNTYTYLYAVYAMEEHPEIRDHIRNLTRIKQMRKTVPLVLNRKLQTDLIPLVSHYVGENY